MRTWRDSVRSALAALALFGAARAEAQLLVVEPPGEPAAIAHAELAYAQGAGAPVTWLSLRLLRGPVAIVAALPADARVDAGLDAWFAALEVTASPNIVLAESAVNCGDGPSFVHVSWPRTAGAPASELSVQSPEDARAALDAQGLTLSGDLPKAERYVIWSWGAEASERTTRTLRIVGGGTPLALLPGASFPVLVTSVTRGAEGLPSELLNRELEVTFIADAPPSSDYRRLLGEFIGRRPEPLLEMRARGPLFDWAIYDDALSLASLVWSYASRAQGELKGLDVDACAQQLRGLRDVGAPSAAACGDAADASLALAAAGSDLPTLQRFAISGSTGFVASALAPGGPPSAPLLRAALLDDSACPLAELPPITVQPPGRGGTYDPGPSGTTTVVIEETVVVDQTEPTEINCGGSPEPQDGYYSNDTSSVDCASDSSSTADDSSSDCSGDSSSDATSQGCSSDGPGSSSSDSGDASCDGGSDESSGYDGETCTGAAAPGAERDAKAPASLASGARARRPRRVKASLWSVAFAAAILPIRRRKRRPGTSG